MRWVEVEILSFRCAFSGLGSAMHLRARVRPQNFYLLPHGSETWPLLIGLNRRNVLALLSVITDLWYWYRILGPRLSVSPRGKMFLNLFLQHRQWNLEAGRFALSSIEANTFTHTAGNIWGSRQCFTSATQYHSINHYLHVCVTKEPLPARLLPQSLSFTRCRCWWKGTPEWTWTTIMSGLPFILS